MSTLLKTPDIKWLDPEALIAGKQVLYAVPPEPKEEETPEVGIEKTDVLADRTQDANIYGHVIDLFKAPSFSEADHYMLRTGLIEPISKVSTEDQLLTEVISLRRANGLLQQALLKETAGELQLHEHHRGIIVRIIDDMVVIRFDTAQGMMEQTYEKGKFVKPEELQEGDRVQVCCFAWTRRHIPQGLESILTQTEIEHAIQADKHRTPSPLEI